MTTGTPNRAARRRAQREQKARAKSGAKSGARGLGRGLDSLIPASAASESGQGQLRAPIGAISPNPSQPRQRFDREQLEELAASIREHGVLQPLLVRPLDMGSYELIAGERRWRAAGLAGLETVPIVVQADGDQEGGSGAEERLTLALVENLQRADLNPIEMATAFERLSESGWTQERIAQQVGKSRAAVANLLRLRRLPEAIQQLVAAGGLSEGHGRALLAAPPSAQSVLAERAIDAGWSVRQLEQAIKASPEQPHAAARGRPAFSSAPSPAMSDAVDILEATLGTKVEIRTGLLGPAGSGRIVIHWYGEEHLTALTTRMIGSLPDDSDDLDEFGV